MKSRSVAERPAVLTCFAYREAYFAEMDGMLATVAEHHPGWSVVTGRGPRPGFANPTLEVTSPLGTHQWTAPVSIDLEGGATDWRRITRLKGWWMSQVFRVFGHLAGDLRRLIWVDADARLGGPLDAELPPDGEAVAGPWWTDPESSAYDGIKSGFLIFQGRQDGPVEGVLSEWSRRCLEEIRCLPSRNLPYHDGDQEVLNDVLKATEAPGDYSLIKLDHNRYCGHLTKYGASKPGTLLIHWLMSARMWRPEDGDEPWPPPEDYRRRVAAESIARDADEREPMRKEPS